MIEASTDRSYAQEIHRRVSKPELIALTTIYLVLSDLVEAGLLPVTCSAAGSPATSVPRTQRGTISSMRRPARLSARRGQWIARAPRRGGRRLGYCLVDHRLKLSPRTCLHSTNLANIYTRIGNPAVDVLEQRVATLEGDAARVGSRLDPGGIGLRDPESGARR